MENLRTSFDKRVEFRNTLNQLLICEKNQLLPNIRTCVHVVLQQFMTFINILLIDILSMQWFLSDTKCLYTIVNILYILCFQYLAEIYFSTSKFGFELRYCISECAHS